MSLGSSLHTHSGYLACRFVTLSAPCAPLSFGSAADVMNDTCDKVPSVCTRHEILSSAFRVLYIGYVCISMDSIVLFVKLCAVLLLSNVSPPAYVSLILVRHADFKPQPLFLPSLNHSSINFTPRPFLTVQCLSCLYSLLGHTEFQFWIMEPSYAPTPDKD